MKRVLFLALITITSSIFTISTSSHNPETNPLTAPLNTQPQTPDQPHTVVIIPPEAQNPDNDHHLTGRHQEPSREMQLVQVASGFFTFLAVSYLLGLIIQRITEHAIIIG